MMLGDYCLATIRDADAGRWESEGFYSSRPGELGFSRLPARDLDAAKALLLGSLPEPCRALVTWEGEL